MLLCEARQVLSTLSAFGTNDSPHQQRSCIINRPARPCITMYGQILVWFVIKDRTTLLVEAHSNENIIRNCMASDSWHPPPNLSFQKRIERPVSRHADSMQSSCTVTSKPLAVHGDMNTHWQSGTVVSRLTRPRIPHSTKGLPSMLLTRREQYSGTARRKSRSLSIMPSRTT